MPVRLVAVLLLGLAACDTATKVPNLGDAYSVGTDPFLDRDVLAVPVTYSGGCESHTFDLEYRVLNDTVDLWLRHDANGDTCEALVFDTVRAPLPEAARGLPPWLYVTETERVRLSSVRAD